MEIRKFYFSNIYTNAQLRGNLCRDLREWQPPQDRGWDKFQFNLILC